MRLAAVFLEHAECVPHVRIFRILLGGFFENLFCGIDAGKTQQRNSLIYFRNVQIGVCGSRVFKIFERLLEQLLVHVGTAKIVQARGIVRVILFLGSGGNQGQRNRKQDCHAQQQFRFH